MSASDETASGLELAKQRATVASGQAKAMGGTQDANGTIELAPYVELRTGGRWYAVDAFSVQRVVAQESITRVPGRGRHILGLALIQDILIPVIDLAIYTNTSEAGIQDRQAMTQARLVVISHKESSVAILAEEARGIEMLPAALEGSPQDIIAGETHWNDQHTFHLDPEALVGLGRG